MKIEGRNAVLEILKTDKDIDKIFIQTGELKGSILKIVSEAKKKNLIISEVPKSKLDEMAESFNHQGVIALVSEYKYCEVEDILKDAKEKNEKPLILILDELNDSYNFGAIIRTAVAMSAHGIIIPKRRSVTVNSAVAKVAVGALEHVKIAKVTNISNTIEKLKDEGLWFVCADMDGENIYDIDLTGSIGIVIGSEGEGVGNLIKKNCDFTAKIPMSSNVESLNASVAASIMMYEANRQRLSKKI